MDSKATPVATTPTWQIAALWALVTIPALWGFCETLVKALRLFTS
ncbi:MULTISPECIES: oxalate:formate antiporter [unclassified Salinisphaera]